MSKKWLTTNTINASIPQLKNKVGSIERVEEDTSRHVNTLLANDRMMYIYSESDNMMLDIVEDGKTAFSIIERKIVLDNGDIVITDPGKSIELNGSNVIYEGERYSSANVINTTVACVVNEEQVKESKEGIGDSPYHSYYDPQKRKRYVLREDVAKEYKDADVKAMSVMEMTSLPDHNINKKFLSGYFPGFIIPSDDFFAYMNKQFSYASKFLEKRAPILASRKPFQYLKESKFTTEQEVIDFIKMTKSSNRRESMTACTLLKFIFLLHKYRENPIFDFWEKCQESDDFLIAYLRGIFNLPSGTEIKKDSKGLFHFTKTFPELKNVEVIITFRVKSLDSLLQKSLGSASYLEFGDFRDIFASTAYIPEKHKKSTVAIMHQFDSHLTQSDAYVKNKGLLNDGNVSETDGYKYQRAKGTIKRGRASSDNLYDVKQIGEHFVNFEYNGIQYGGQIGMENKFLYGSPISDVNEVGLTCHPVYAYFSKHFEGEQNRVPFYSASNLSNLFDDFFNYLKEETHEKYPDLIFWQVLKDIDNELTRENDNAGFPKKESSESTLSEFYHSKIKLRLFNYFVDKFELQRMSYGNELVFVSHENRHQLRAGGRGYKIKD